MGEGRNYVRVSELARHVDEAVWLRGWVYHLRSSKKVRFIELRDGSGVVQCIASVADLGEQAFEAAGQLGQECTIECSGVVRRHPKRAEELEVHVSSLSFIPTRGEFPISPKEHGTDFLMDHRALWLRSRRQHAILRVRHSIIRAIRDFFDDRDFTLVDAPIFTPNACEGTSTLFETDYHGQKAFLTQSGQLYMEAAAAAFGRVYCFGPTFRAEKSKTRRHLSEFWMVEPEVAFLDLDGDMQLAEDFLCHVVQRVLAERQTELTLLERDTSKLAMVKPPFPRISYDDAVALLAGLGVQVAPDDDFGAEQETVLSEQFDRPVVVHRYPSQCKAFYMKQDSERPGRALCMDVLAPEGYGEIVGGGQREDDLDVLERAITAHELPREAFDWYLDLRRFGTFPHAGFGLGVERTVAWLCGLPHVRETIPFPRTLNRLSP
jgi:asparaginyl-tRNA synthetase